MSNELVINRFGAFAGGSPDTNHPGLRGEDLVLAFRKQTERMDQSLAFQKANDAILDVVRSFDKTAHEVVSDSDADDNEAYILGMVSKNPTDSDATDRFVALVGLLPFKMLRCRLEDWTWSVRTRASMTACALQRVGRATKLWWSFEGIPDSGEDTKRSLSEAQAAAFVTMTEEMEKVAMPHLRDAYCCALKESSDVKCKDMDLGERIRISLTDNDTRPVAELLDALYFRRSAPSQIKAEGVPGLSHAREGLDQLERFVGDATHHQVAVNNETVRIDHEIPGVKGILCRREGTARDATLVVGFARRAGMGSGFITRPEPWLAKKREDYIRTMSPARQLSARLANTEAQALEKRLELA